MKRSHIVKAIAAVAVPALLFSVGANAALDTASTTALTGMQNDITEVGTYLIPAAAFFSAVGWVVARI